MPLLNAFRTAERVCAVDPPAPGGEARIASSCLHRLHVLLPIGDRIEHGILAEFILVVRLLLLMAAEVA